MKNLSLILLLILTQACRTARDTVEIQDAKAPTRPPSADYPKVERSVETTFSITAISLPTQSRGIEYLDLSLRLLGETSDLYSSKSYTAGEELSIEPHRDYEVVLSAFRGTTEIYSTKFCSQRQSFRAEEGPNQFTASLCAKPGSP